MEIICLYKESGTEKIKIRNLIVMRVLVSG